MRTKLATWLGLGCLVAGVLGTCSANANPAATAAWRAAERQYGNELEDLYWFATKKPEPGSTAAMQHADRALRALQKRPLDGLRPDCASGRFTGERAGTAYRKEYMRAATLCPLVLRSQEIYRRALRAWELHDLAGRIAEIRRRAEHAGTKLYVSDVVKGFSAEDQKAYVSSFVTRHFEALGEPIPSAALAPLDEVAALFRQTASEAAARTPLPKGKGRDAGAERAIRETYGARNPGIKILRIVMDDAQWQIVRSPIGAVLRRYKNATVILKAKDGFCAAVPASVGQPYQMGGRFGPKYGVDEFLEGTPVKCP
jgi:hypothetical protein